MNIIEAMDYLRKHPNGEGSVYRREWHKYTSKSFVYLVGDVNRYGPGDIVRPECYRVTNGSPRSNERRYEFDYCDVVADDWEIYR